MNVLILLTIERIIRVHFVKLEDGERRTGRRYLSLKVSQARALFAHFFVERKIANRTLFDSLEGCL